MKGDGRDVLKNNIYLYISAFFDAAALSPDREREVINIALLIDNVELTQLI